MKNLDQLPEVVNETLGGLTAGQNLKLRIEKAVQPSAQTPVRRRARAWIPALACALVVALGAVFAVPALMRQQEQQPLIVSQAAGDGQVGIERGTLGMVRGNTTIVADRNTPSYRSLWAESTNGAFPLLGINGRYYRLLTSPDSVSDRVLDESCGTVAEFTAEPSLSGNDVVLSNTAPVGTAIYPVSGMESTLVAAQIDGNTRLFQRVGFNGNALKGNESLADTLQIAGHIIGMELSDVGSVTDADACETLFDTLVSNASYESSGSVSGQQSLLIELDNGLTVQLAVKNDRFSACGTWSCPEFFEAFEAAAE